MKILVTGAAGFIGSALCRRLAKSGQTVVGIDNLNDYYDPRLKIGRLSSILGISPDPAWPMVVSTPATGRDRRPVSHPDFPRHQPIESTLFPGLTFIRMDINDRGALESLCSQCGFDVIVNLAAQAGVRYSIDNPQAYIESNIDGFLNILECARRFSPKHLVYASSSSVYGGNVKVPFSEGDPVNAPVSLYAATKRSNELMASVYSRLYGISATGLRFFTVYGPWGRPDMAPMLFASAILAGEPIKVFNHGDMSRDFTYIDDIVEGIVKVIDIPPIADEDGVSHTIYNIGRGNPVSLMEFISILENALGREAEKIMLPMQKGDVPTTYADTARLAAAVGYSPHVDLREGIAAFAEWYKTGLNDFLSNSRR